MSRERNPIPQPTEAELVILRILWTRGPRTVRQVFEEMQGEEKKGYTTILKQLQIMYDKGLVDRTEQGQSHVYRSRVREAATRQRLVRTFLERMFGGSAHELVMEVLSTHKSSPEELEELHNLLKDIEH